MKKIQIAVLALALVMLCTAFTSCGAEKVTATVKVLIVAGDDTVLNNVELTVEGTAENPPTVLQAVREAMALYEISYTLSDNEKSLRDVSTYKDHTDDNGVIYYWEYSIMAAGATTYTVPKADSGKAADNVVTDGDAIKYTYMTMVYPEGSSDVVVSEYVTPSEDDTTTAEG